MVTPGKWVATHVLNQPARAAASGVSNATTRFVGMSLLLGRGGLLDTRSLKRSRQDAKAFSFGCAQLTERKLLFKRVQNVVSASLAQGFAVVLAGSHSDRRALDG